jgi:hypothetical protein
MFWIVLHLPLHLVDQRMHSKKTYHNHTQFQVLYCESTSYYKNLQQTLIEIQSFATSHYATDMQLVVVCNYFDHVYNYKFGII